MRFYVDQLRFRLIVDQRVGGFRWIEVAPPDGSANLALVQAQADSVAELVGRDTRIYFITEDIQTKYEEWSSRGVRFRVSAVQTAMGRNLHEIRGSGWKLVWLGRLR